MRRMLVCEPVVLMSGRLVPVGRGRVALVPQEEPEGAGEEEEVVVTDEEGRAGGDEPLDRP